MGREGSGHAPEARFDGGEHWLVEARSVPREALAGPRGRRALLALFEALVTELALHPLGAPLVHTFDGEDGAAGAGGSTALLALTESHLAAHGFPEAGVLCLDLFTCRPRAEARFEALVRAALGGGDIEVRRVPRGGVGVGGPR